MASPPEGDYIIYNRALSATGLKLALTFSGNREHPIVQPLDRSLNQVWTLKHYSGSTFNVVPKKDGALQVALDGPVITVLPAGSYTFSFKDVGDGYNIQTGSMTANWGLERAIAGADVAVTNDNGQATFRWVLELV